jgi:Protein of unknown function (DUF2946)
LETLRRHVLVCHRLALLAVLALALLPTVTQALGWASPPASGRVEVCTPKGVLFVVLPSGDLATTPSEGSDDHGLCCTGVALVPLPTPPDFRVWGPAALLLPDRAPHVRGGVLQWGPAQPRAPPVTG